MNRQTYTSFPFQSGFNVHSRGRVRPNRMYAIFQTKHFRNGSYKLFMFKIRLLIQLLLRYVFSTVFARYLNKTVQRYPVKEGGGGEHCLLATPIARILSCGTKHNGRRRRRRPFTFIRKQIGIDNITRSVYWRCLRNKTPIDYSIGVIVLFE